MAYESSDSRERRRLNGKRVPLSTYLEPDLYDELVKLAAHNERPVAAEVRLAIRQHLEARDS